MKKMVLAACFGIMSIAAKAQTAAIQCSSATSLPVSVLIIGNNDPRRICLSGLNSTVNIPLTTTPVVINASSATPTPLTNIVDIGVSVVIGGSQYGTKVSLCGIAPGKYPLSLGGGTYTCTMQVMSASPSMTVLYFY